MSATTPEAIIIKAASTLLDASYYDDLDVAKRDHLRATARQTKAALEKLMPSLLQPCAWAEDADGTWHTRCGQTWFYDSGTPAENKQTYCHHCGRKLRAFAYQESP